MADLYTVTTTPTFIGATPNDPIKFTHAGGGTLYYDDVSTVTSSGPGDGNITTGASVTRTGGTWLVSASVTKVAAVPAESPTVSSITVTEDVTVGDDLTVTDDATITDDLAVTGLATVGETLGVTGVSSTAGGIVTGGATPTTAAKGITFGTGTGPATLYRSGADTLTSDDALTVAGTLTASAALDHDGTTVGFYGVTPATRPTAYTQTYSTAAKTVPDATVGAVTTTGVGLTAYGYTQAQGDQIPVAINALTADVLALKKVITALIDDLQSLGIVT